MRNKKVYVNRGDEAYIAVIFVPDEFTADASGAKEARDLGMFVEEKPVIVGQECISVMPIEQVVRFGQKSRATPQPADNWIKCSERLPTEADEDCEGKIWCGYRDQITKKVAGPWCRSVNDLLVLANQYPGSSYWQRTGLKRPNPPAEGAE